MVTSEPMVRKYVFQAGVTPTDLTRETRREGPNDIITRHVTMEDGRYVVLWITWDKLAA